MTMLGQWAPAQGADWSTFRGNMQRTGSTSEKIVGPPTARAWEISLGGTVVSSPSVVDGVIYIGCRDDHLYAIDASDGSILWKARTGGWVDASPLVYGGKVVVPSRGDSIHILEANTGNQIAAHFAGTQLSSPGLAGPNLLVSGMGPPFQRVSAFRFADDDWKQVDGQWLVNFSGSSYSSPAIHESMIVLGSNDGTLYGIDTLTQDTAWVYRCGGSMYMSSPAIDTASGVAYFSPGGTGPSVYAIRVSDGSLVWNSSGSPKARVAKQTRKTGISPDFFVRLLRVSPTMRRLLLEREYGPGYRMPKVLAGGPKKGLALADFFSYGEVKTSSVAIGSLNVYVAQKELGHPHPRYSIKAYDKATGSEAWPFTPEMRGGDGPGYTSSPIVAGNMVFVGWGEGKLYALSSQTGEKLWEDSLGASIVSSPAISDGKLFVATLAGGLYAYQLQEPVLPADFKEGTYCFPNPAKTVSNIQYFLTKPGDIEVRVYDFSERLVEVFRESSVTPNTVNLFQWDISNAANGVYFGLVKVTYEDGAKEQKILKIAILK